MFEECPSGTEDYQVAIARCCRILMPATGLVAALEVATVLRWNLPREKHAISTRI